MAGRQEHIPGPNLQSSSGPLLSPLLYQGSNTHPPKLGQSANNRAVYLHGLAPAKGLSEVWQKGEFYQPAVGVFFYFVFI